MGDGEWGRYEFPISQNHVASSLISSVSVGLFDGVIEDYQVCALPPLDFDKRVEHDF